jgi:Zn-dependent protease/CBS domain-containing protein
MRWSFVVGRIAGIELRLHAAFFLILLLGPSLAGPEYGVPGALFGIFLLVLLFMCVALHELGHSLVAQRLGLKVREIMLLPIGGVARATGHLRKPWYELLVAAAGPLTSLALAFVLSLGLHLDFKPGMKMEDALKAYQALLQGPPGLTMALVWLCTANVWLVLFNLIPAFPMDGGRMLRGLLSLFLPSAKATAFSVLVGQILAVLMGVFAFRSSSIMLGIVAVFVFFGAGREQAEERTQELLSGVKAGTACKKPKVTLSPADTVGSVMTLLLEGYQRDFPVMSGDKLEGVMGRDDALRAAAQGRQGEFVAGLMRRDLPKVDENETLEQARERLIEAERRLAVVCRGDQVLGLLSLEDIDEAMIVAAHLRAGKGQ